MLHTTITNKRLSSLLCCLISSLLVSSLIFNTVSYAASKSTNTTVEKTLTKKERRALARKKRKEARARRLAKKNKANTTATATKATVAPPALLWHTTVNSKIITPPKVLGSSVYFATAKNQLIIVDKNTGHVRTTLEMKGFKKLTDLTVVSVNQALLSTEIGLLSLNPQTDSQQWLIETPLPVKSAPLVANNIVYFSSQNGMLQAVDLASGQAKWQFDTEQLLEASPVISKGTVYIADYDGNAYAIEATSGTLKWKERIEGPITSAALVDEPDETVYFSSNVGAVFALFTGNGRKKWSYTSVTGAPIVSQPLPMRDGSTFIADTDGRIGGANQQFGIKTWQAILDYGGIYSDLKSDGKSIVALTAKGTLLGINPENGDVQWKQPLNDSTPYSITQDGQRLFITSQTGKLYALGLQ